MSDFIIYLFISFLNTSALIARNKKQNLNPCFNIAESVNKESSLQFLARLGFIKKQLTFTDRKMFRIS